MPYVMLSVALMLVAVACSPSTAPSSSRSPAQSARFDVIITGGRIVDGTGAPWFEGDVGIVGDRITAVGRLENAAAASSIDARGAYVAPGFIDMLGQSELNVLADARAASKITQGITTEITGEGSAIAPLNDRLAAEAKPSFESLKVTLDFRTLGEYFTRLETRSRPAINLGTLVGAGGIRAYVIGDQQRVATAEELEQMKTLVRQAMQQGALGLSTSLQYVPDRFASTEEIVELAKVAAEYGGRYFTHQRSESGRIIDSLNEAFTVAEQARIPAEIWHLKTAYRANWGRMPEVLKHIEAARARGLDVTANMYPYDRASNGLDACLPLWVRDGGTERDDCPSQGSGPAGTHQARHGRSQSRGLGEPVVRLRRRRRCDAVVGARLVAPQVGRQDARGDRQGDGQGSARCRHGPGHRRPRGVLRDHLDHARRRRAHGPGAPDDRDRDGFRCARRGRAAVDLQVSPARVGLVHENPRHLRA